jgi:hypothetical protein
MKEVIMDKFEKAFEKANNFTFDKFQFDNPDYEMLVFDEDSYLEHLRVQSAGIAYFGSLSKSADRRFEDLERRYKIRYNEMFSECSDTLFKIGKKAVRDVEALVQCKYEDELKKWETALEEARVYKDNANAFYEAWKNKSFGLNSMTRMITSGLLSPKTSISEDEVSYKRKKGFNVEDAHRILGKNS